MARDVALIDHLRVDAVDVIGFSMGAGTAARLLLLRPPQVKSAILAGFGDYAMEDTVMEFPKSWPVPDSVPRPITVRVWLEEGAKILEKGEMVPGHLASANLIGARITGTDPKVIAAVIRGALMNSLSAEALQRVDIPVLILNGKADAANEKIPGFSKQSQPRAPGNVKATTTPRLTSQHFSRPSSVSLKNNGGCAVQFDANKISISFVLGLFPTPDTIPGGSSVNLP